MADNLVSRIYGNFRGVDFRGEEINLMRSPDSLNMWKDYKETESIRTRPEMELQVSFDAPVYGLFFYGDIQLVHSGTNLYKVENGDQTILYAGLNEKRSVAFVYEDVWYFKDGKNYLQYDGSAVKAVEGYVPTTTIGRKPAGGGTKHEDVNMLSDYRINSFLADGGSFDFYLDVINIDEDFVPVVTVNDEVVSTDEYTVDYAQGKITFTNYAPDAPKTDGQDNVTVKFKNQVSGYRENILKCTLLQLFDNRVFVSGNEDYPNVVWHCSLNNPTYWSDLDYYREGLDSAQIRGLVAGNNALWVFREPSDANTTVFYHTPTTDDEYGKIYPSTHSSVSTGCVGGAINFNDDIVFFSERGMEGISGDITTEQVVAHRSSLVDRKLITEDGYKDMILEEWEGYLLVFIGNKVYLADSRTAFSNEGHIEYDWFYWEMPHKISCTCVKDGILHLGTDNGIFTLTDTTCNVESYWVTPKDVFKYPHRQKTTNKRGCVAEATGDITVYAKLEEGAFEFVGEYREVTDAFVSRIKRKKFKDIQLKFHSNTRFSLETVTLECFVGGYVKRTGVVSYTNPEASKNAAILEDCNEALTDKGVEVADTLEQVPQRIGEIQTYDEGYEDGYDKGKIDGNLFPYAKSISGMFRNAVFPDGYEITINAHSIENTNIGQLFLSAKGVRKIILDIPTNLVYRANDFVYGVDSVEEVILPDGIMFENINYFATDRKALRKVGGRIDFTNVVGANIFNGCNALEEFYIMPNTMRLSFNVGHSPLLIDACVQSLVDGYADMTGQTAPTLTVHKTVYEKMSDEQKATLTAKNVNLATL